MKYLMYILFISILSINCFISNSFALEENKITNEKIEVSQTKIFLSDDEFKEAILDYIKKKRGNLPIGKLVKIEKNLYKKRDSLEYVYGYYAIFIEYYYTEPFVGE